MWGGVKFLSLLSLRSECSVVNAYFDDVTRQERNNRKRESSVHYYILDYENETKIAENTMVETTVQASFKTV